MRANQSLNYDDLRNEALEAVKRSTKSQSDIARDLGKTRSAVSRALTESGPTLSKLQCEIIAHLTGYVLEERVEYVVRKKTD